jgi:hypothetical protein
MATTRVGATQQYAENWDNIFGGGKGKPSAKKKTATRLSARAEAKPARSTKRKAAKSTKKKASKPAKATKKKSSKPAAKKSTKKKLAAKKSRKR